MSDGLTREKKAALAKKFGLMPPSPPAGTGPGRHYRREDGPLPPRQVWQLVPGQGIGPLKLDMTREALERALEQAQKTWAPAEAPELERVTDLPPGGEGVSVRYTDGDVFFLVRYVRERAVEITTDRMSARRVEVRLEDASMFDGSAAEGICRFGLMPGEPGYGRPGLLLWQEVFREDEPFDFAAVLPLSQPPMND